MAVRAGVEVAGQYRGRGLTVAALLLSTAAGLGLAVFAGVPFATAQSATGAAINVDPAGNGTGEAMATFDPLAAGLANAGHGALTLGDAGGRDEPFDMSGARRPVSPARSAALSLHSRVGPLAPAGLSSAALTTPSHPAPANPGKGAGTPSGHAPSAATPGSPVPSGATPASVQPFGAVPAEAAARPVPGAGVSAKLAELTGSQLARFVADPAGQQAIASFYAARANQPVFVEGGRISPLGQIALDQFAAALIEGLNPHDYVVPALPPGAVDAQLAEAELRIAATTLLYARHLQSGRFDPKRISKDVDPSPTVPDPAAVLAQVTGSSNPRAAFEAFAPQYDEYRLLRAQLAKAISQGRGVVHAAIPAGPTIRPGASDPRVPLLRERLGVPGHPADQRYDEALVAAMRDFQSVAGLGPDGLVGPATVAVLNAQGGDAVGDIIANMERWRWLPHEVAPVYVMVNIPEYSVRIVVNEQTVHETRAIVGKPDTQTPIMTEDMKYAVFNPSWTVPPTIIRQKMLPKLMSNPYALEREGINVVRNGRIIDPGTVDWRRGTQGYSFRQEPGERNALGRMKFMFPNKHAVYLHDTPNRSLFTREQRALSFGCVRVHEPLAFAEALFALGLPNEGWTAARVTKQFGGNEKYLNMKQRFPVHLVYFTTYVDGSGRLVSREDIYGTNAVTKSILGLDGARRMAAGGEVPLRR